jgi:biotin carboxyl carrier protein
MAVIEVRSETAGSIWRVYVAAGDTVAADHVLMILESMKMEIPISAPTAGRVTEILVSEGDPVSGNQIVALLEST